MRQLDRNLFLAKIDQGERAFLHGSLPALPMSTERPSPRYSDIDVWEPSDIIEAMIEGQFTAVAAVRAARFALAAATLAAEASLRNGGPLAYSRGATPRPR